MRFVNQYFPVPVPPEMLHFGSDGKRQRSQVNNHIARTFAFGLHHAPPQPLAGALQARDGHDGMTRGQGADNSV